MDICSSLKKHGIQKIVVINGHAGNISAGNVAVRMAMDELGLTTALLSYWEVLRPEEVKNILDTYPRYPGHACEFETSIGLFLYPDLVHLKAINDLEEIPESSYQKFLTKTTIERSKTGVPYGKPTIATPEKGEKLLDLIVDGIASFLRYFATCKD